MTSSPTPSVVFGGTGLVGRSIVSALLGLDAAGTVHTISRRAPKQAPSPKLDAVVEPDTAQWVSRMQALASEGDKAAFPPTVFSALGTTRAQAGGIANQWKIDHDLNIEIARAAKQAGARTFVFVSSGGIRGLVGSRMPYSQMKIGVEDAIRELAFEQAIILRPGLILGEREVPHTGGPLLSSIVRGLGSYVSTGLQDSIGQDAEVIARAAVHAALLADQGKAPDKYWILPAAEIVRLGRTEWKF